MSLSPVMAGALAARFGGDCDAAEDRLDPTARAGLLRLAERRSCRAYRPDPVPEGLMRLVLAAGLSAPSKSDLQQADVIWLRDPAIRAEVTQGCGDWIAGAPEFLVICADGRRLARLLGPENPNDHFDALFNATGDAAILLASLVAAATLAGLGSCPVSVIRNRPEAVARALALPRRVIPFAGLALGWPAEPRAPISPRLGMEATVHTDRFDEHGQNAAIAAYDARRAATAPYAVQREPERYGLAPLYGWSEEKRRHYGTAQREDWGAFVRASGFLLD